jgi:hypothetical protein
MSSKYNSEHINSDDSDDYDDNSDDSQDNIAVRLPTRSRGSNVISSLNIMNSTQLQESNKLKGNNSGGFDKSNGLVIPLSHEYMDPVEVSILADQLQVITYNIYTLKFNLFILI